MHNEIYDLGPLANAHVFKNSTLSTKLPRVVYADLRNKKRGSTVARQIMEPKSIASNTYLDKAT